MNDSTDPAEPNLIESEVERYGYRFIVVHNPVTNIAYMKSGSKVKIEKEISKMTHTLKDFPCWNEIGDLVKAQKIESGADNALIISPNPPSEDRTLEINALLEKHFGAGVYEWFYELERAGPLQMIPGAYRFFKLS